MRGLGSDFTFLFLSDSLKEFSQSVSGFSLILTSIGQIELPAKEKYSTLGFLAILENLGSNVYGGIPVEIELEFQYRKLDLHTGSKLPLSTVTTGKGQYSAISSYPIT